MKVLFISRNFYLKQDGGSIVALRNRNLLKKIGCEVTEFIIDVPSIFTRVKNIILRESYGNTSSLNEKLKYHLTQKYDFVFFDGSYYGVYLREFASKGFNTICFFHNVEAIYYEHKYNTTHKFSDKLMINYIKFNEGCSVKNASSIIVLNSRDSDNLNRTYGRKADFVMPTSFDPISSNIIEKFSKINFKYKDYLLFVGSNFFANVQAIEFYIKNIAPYVNKQLIIVGNISDAFISKDVPNNVLFLGSVDDLTPYYLNAVAVVAPILSGSGLKTKTVEALRYGKFIIGSSECFEGVPLHEFSSAGIICATSADYINAINSLDNLVNNTDSMLLFSKFFSHDSVLKKLKFFLREKLNIQNSTIE